MKEEKPFTGKSTVKNLIHDDEKKNKYDRSGYKDFVAGTFGGMAGVLAGHPFDTVKVKIQTMPEKYSSNVFKTFVKVLKKEGVANGLYRGMMSPIIGVGFINSIIFGVYGNTMKTLKQYRNNVTEQTGKEETEFQKKSDIFWSGAFAGFSNSIICSPIELTKTRLQVQKDQLRKHILLRSRGDQSLFQGPLDCLQKIYRKEGIRGVYRGLSPTLWREIPSYGVYFLSYEMMREYFGSNNFTLFMSGGISGVLAWALSYPFDVVKSRMQAMPETPFPGHDKYEGMWDCTKQCYKEGGIRVFFRGFSACLVRAFPVNAVTFLVYETCMKLL